VTAAGAAAAPDAAARMLTLSAAGGDLIVVLERLSSVPVRGTGTTNDLYRVGVVTRAGRREPSMWRPAGDFGYRYDELADHGQRLRSAMYVQHWIMPAGQIDVPGALATAAARRPTAFSIRRVTGDEAGRLVQVVAEDVPEPYASLDEVRVALSPHLMVDPDGPWLRLHAAALAWDAARREAWFSDRAAERAWAAAQNMEWSPDHAVGTRPWRPREAYENAVKTANEAYRAAYAEHAAHLVVAV
jgi:hypothetical protein